MSARPILTLLILVGSTAPLDQARACGDKFTLTSSNCRILPAPHREGRLVVYRGSKDAEDMLNSKLVEVLHRSGHEIQVATTLDEMKEKLAGAVDLVLAYRDDADTLIPLLADSASHPEILPLMFKATQFEEAKVRKEFHHVLNAPVTASRLSETINQALGSR